INLFNRRRKDVIDVVVGEQGSVFCQVAWITFEVFTWTKLGRVYKHRDHDHVAHSSIFTNQPQVSFVQCSHRWHETDSPVLLAADFARDGTHALTAIDDLHSKRGWTRTGLPFSLRLFGCL